MVDEPNKAESSARTGLWSWDTFKWLVGAAVIPTTAAVISH
jgi:hypothetical protein